MYFLSNMYDNFIILCIFRNYTYKIKYFKLKSIQKDDNLFELLKTEILEMYKRFNRYFSPKKHSLENETFVYDVSVFIVL